MGKCDDSHRRFEWIYEDSRRSNHTLMPSDIANNIAKVRERIRRACIKSGRPESAVTLLAVAKTQPATALRAAYEAGLCDIGENYCQEAEQKIAALPEPGISWHFIGPLQSNKTRPVASLFSWVHSVDRLKIAQRLSEQRPAQLPPLNVCLQVNIDAEPSKSGVAPADLAALINEAIVLPNLHLRGLMAIPQPHADLEQRRESFIHLRELLETLRRRWPQLDTLSMGMSSDLELAIAEGATIVRVGTDIFGTRPPANDPAGN